MERKVGCARPFRPHRSDRSPTVRPGINGFLCAAWSHHNTSSPRKAGTATGRHRDTSSLQQVLATIAPCDPF